MFSVAGLPLATIDGMAAFENPSSVEFWFDPACPWCWITSRWLNEVSEARGFAITWHTYSLAVRNEEPGKAPRPAHADSLHYLRVIEAARAEGGDDVVGPLYSAIGSRVHPGQRSDVASVIEESLAEVGLPASLADAALLDVREPGHNGFDDVVRASTERAVSLVGTDVGIPVLAIDGSGFFGPVISPAPTGDDALRLFDAVAAATRIDGFFELKRTRNVGPQFS